MVPDSLSWGVKLRGAWDSVYTSSIA